MHQHAFHYPERAGYKAEGTSQNVLALTPANQRIAA